MGAYHRTGLSGFCHSFRRFVRPCGSLLPGCAGVCWRDAYRRRPAPRRCRPAYRRSRRCGLRYGVGRSVRERSRSCSAESNRLSRAFPALYARDLCATFTIGNKLGAKRRAGPPDTAFDCIAYRGAHAIKVIGLRVRRRSGVAETHTNLCIRKVTSAPAR